MKKNEEGLKNLFDKEFQEKMKALYGKSTDKKIDEKVIEKAKKDKYNRY